MKPVTIMTVTFCIILIAGSSLSVTACQRKLLEVELHDFGWEADMGVLDRLSNEMQHETDSISYIILYGGRRGISGETKKRAACMKAYMLHRRGFGQDRIIFIEGGYREKPMMEVWITKPGASAPDATPTVVPKEIRLRKGKVKYSCEI